MCCLKSHGMNGLPFMLQDKAKGESAMELSNSQLQSSPVLRNQRKSDQTSGELSRLFKHRENWQKLQPWRISKTSCSLKYLKTYLMCLTIELYTCNGSSQSLVQISNVLLDLSRLCRTWGLHPFTFSGILLVCTVLETHCKLPNCTSVVICA